MRTTSQVVNEVTRPIVSTSTHKFKDFFYLCNKLTKVTKDWGKLSSPHISWGEAGSWGSRRQIAMGATGYYEERGS